jgi:hypothetical protein
MREDNNVATIIRCGVCAAGLPIDGQSGKRFILRDAAECTRCGAPKLRSMQHEDTQKFKPAFLGTCCAEAWAGSADIR